MFPVEFMSFLLSVFEIQQTTLLFSTKPLEIITKKALQMMEGLELV